MPELGLFHHSSLAATKAAYTNHFSDGPEFDDWVQHFSTNEHGDFRRWQSALAALPELAVEQVQLGNRVRAFGQLTHSHAPQLQQLQQSLREFMPWRKGPFQLFNQRISTEWRSDWKWQRLAPHLPKLGGQRILDVGCGNGYFGWRLLAAGAKAVLGVDPTLLFCMQHLVINRYLANDANWVLPIRFEELPGMQFDGVMSMGVLYHRRDPQAHVTELVQQLKPGGWLALESLVMPPGQSIYPATQPKTAPGHRYARMRNVWCVPDTALMLEWMAQAGCTEVRLVDECVTTIAEQQPTPWMRFESLAHTLNPQDPTQTVEGYPAPQRAIVMGRRPER